MKRYELLLKGGMVIDPAQKLHTRRDIAIVKGKIAAIEPEIPMDQAQQTIRVEGKYVTPGLVDLHAHVYYGVTTWGIRADPLCTTTGVTTIVDAGSASWATFPGFREFIVEPARTRILAYIHISGIGLVYGPVGEMLDLAYADPEKVAETAKEHPDLIVGVKVRQAKFQVGDNGLKPLELAIQAAEAAGLPVMCHIGAGIPLPEVLRRMRPGDVITHCFQGNGDNLVDEKGKVIPEGWEAKERGVIFDIGHGMGSFRYEISRQAIEQGFLPDVISTDIHTGNIHGPVYDFPTTLSKFLHLGLSLDDVIEKATIAPAKVIHREEELGHLKVGTVADIAVWELLEGSFEFFDTHGTRFVGNQKLEPCLTIRAGKVL